MDDNHPDTIEVDGMTFYYEKTPVGSLFLHATSGCYWIWHNGLKYVANAFSGTSRTKKEKKKKNKKKENCL
jgi:hypothetical protein